MKEQTIEDSKLAELRDKAFNLLITDSSGIYVPQIFAERVVFYGYRRKWFDMDAEERDSIG